jgi:hypothetical protein
MTRWRRSNQQSRVVRVVVLGFKEYLATYMYP